MRIILGKLRIQQLTTSKFLFTFLRDTSMKFLTFLFVFLLIGCVELRSQEYPSFDATAGILPAKKVADTIMTDASLVGVLTPGQNKTIKINLPFKIEKVDSTKCCVSYAWVYSYRGKSKKTDLDTLLSIEVICVRYNPLFPILFPTYTLDLKINDTTVLFPEEFTLPSNFLSSDNMITNIKATTGYKSYIQDNPKSRPSIIALRYTPSCLFFPDNSPIWRMNFSGATTNETLNCEVHAISGEAKCVANAVGVDDESTTNNLTITPNPASNQAVVSIPNELFSPTISLELFNSIGVSINKFSVYTNIGEKIVIPFDGLTEGVYFIKFSNGKNIITKPLVIKH